MAFIRRTRKSNKPKSQILEVSIPNHFRCPISLDLMKDPVTVSTGITYDRQSIETWFDTGNCTCPVTNQELAAADAIPNHALRRLIQDWCVKNRSNGVERIPTPKIPISPLQATEILSEVSSSRNHVKVREMVAKIGRLAKESERNRRCFVSAGAARVLAAEFARCSSFNGVQEEILSIISCFSPLDQEACRYFGSRGSLKAIAFILKNGYPAVRLNAVSLLREILSTSKDIVRVANESDELIGSLIELIRKPISPRATKTSLAASFILISSNEKTAIKFAESGFVHQVLEILVDSDKGMCEKALAVIDAICGTEIGREEAYGHALTVPVLVKKMFRVSDLATEFVVSALWKLCKDIRGEERGVLAEAIQVGAFQKVLLLLQVGCSGGVKVKATELLKLMNGSKEKFDCVDAVDFRGLKRSL
ncbi:uncharacterized protein A4U43_C03F15810 [Asparagus officinalis]|uniref:U-box domain-containing protein n=1 Tax=Asparagus officinalis TaxID=4686 RepID=A0A5P1FEM7_ASPOF|nr:U-box domain-containing protein 21-like [Asparagus officinalis]ONK75339.1 uncharacterized protein A4U43_C03F15810 [Asparagus officinalis]